MAWVCQCQQERSCLATLANKETKSKLYPKRRACWFRYKKRSSFWKQGQGGPRFGQSPCHTSLTRSRSMGSQNLRMMSPACPCQIVLNSTWTRHVCFASRSTPPIEFRRLGLAQTIPRTTVAPRRKAREGSCRALGQAV